MTTEERVGWSRATPEWILLATVSVGIGTGLLEAAIHAVRRFGLGRLIWLGSEFAWMTPVGYVILFAGPGLPLALLARRWPGPAARVAVWLFVALGSFSLLWHLRMVHPAALAILAMGAATQAVRFVGKRFAGAEGGARRWSAGLAAVTAVLFLGGWGWRAGSEWTGLRGLPEADPGAPNIVLVILDTVRARQLDLYGYRRPTAPFLRAFAESAVVFDRAMSPSPSSLPGHAALLTGLLPHQTEADWRSPLEGGVPTLGQVLQGRGYATAAVSGNLFYFTRESGLARGFNHFDGYDVSFGQLLRSTALGQFLIQTQAQVRSGGRFQAPVGWLTQGKSSEAVLDQAERWLRGAPDRPFFLTVNFLDAHRPYRPPEPFRGRFLRGCLRTLTVPECVAQTRTDLYDGAVAHTDAALGELLEVLEALGRMENTVVMVTADHGEQLGENGLIGHGNSLYWPSLHVPLVVKTPSGPRGVRVYDPVSLADVPATLADLAGAQASSLPGASLTRFWRPGPPAGADAPLVASARGSLNRPPSEPLSRGDMYAVLDWPLHYILNGDGIEELYNLELDPLESRDLSGSPMGQVLIGPLRDALPPTVATTGASPSGSELQSEEGR